MDLHGGNIYKYIREGKNIELDYSSNINPYGIDEKFKKYIFDNLDIVTKYPDINYHELSSAIAKFNNTAIENVLVGNGATEILFLYMKSMKIKKVLLLAPCFAEYKRALDSVEAEIIYFELKEEKDFTLDDEELSKLCLKLKEENFDLLLLCNPNNPTGKFISLEKIKKLASFSAEQNIKFFIDEAFIEFIEDWKEKTAFLLQEENIFVMRALTKFFAIPGLRLGYGLSKNKAVIEKLRQNKEPWSVNAVANLAGIYLLQDEAYIKKTERWIKEEKEIFYKDLSEIKNIKVYRTEVNFILLKLLNMTVSELQKRMVAEGILIRDASNFKFLNENFVRLAIKDRASNEKVLASLKKNLGGLELL